jgi:hypothetical protein
LLSLHHWLSCDPLLLNIYSCITMQVFYLCDKDSLWDWAVRFNHKSHLKHFFYFSYLAKILWFDIFLYLPTIVHDGPRVLKRRDLIVLYVPHYFSSKLEMSLLLNLHLKYRDLPKIVFSKACLHILNLHLKYFFSWFWTKTIIYWKKASWHHLLYVFSNQI